MKGGIPRLSRAGGLLFPEECLYAVPQKGSLARIGGSVVSRGPQRLKPYISGKENPEMAQTVKIILEDDLEGGSADETVRFGLDGAQYEIDLNSANADKLRSAIRPFVSKARRAQAKTGPGRPAGKTSSGTRGNPDTPKIRAWAKENNYNVSDRGRIHQEVQDAYYAAHK